MSEQFIEVDSSIGEKVSNIEWKKDNINPDHYKNQTSLECIEAMELMFGEDAILKFCLCNAYKYIWRYKNKNGQTDLKKARWYLNRAFNIITYYDGDAESDERIMIRRMEKYIVDHLEDENG